MHPPFLLPGDPLTFDFNYPEGFNITNATEAASAAAASASQASAASVSPVLPPATTTTQGRTEPTPGVRNLNYPPYVINNVQAGHALGKSSIAPNATHNDQYNTTEYEMHNLFGLQISNATYHSLLELFPGRRPFTVGRSVFAGSGKTTSHWGGDNTVERAKAAGALDFQELYPDAKVSSFEEIAERFYQAPYVPYTSGH